MSSGVRQRHGGTCAIRGWADPCALGPGLLSGPGPSLTATVVRVIVAVAPDLRRSVAWVSITDTGDVSAGLTDRRIVVFCPGGERDGTRNPHFTFHPPIYHPLRANGEPEVSAAIMEVGLMLHQTGTVPWVRLVSRPYEQLEPTQASRRGTSVLDFPIENPALSAEIELEFVASGTNSTQGLMGRQVTDDMNLRLRVGSCPPSVASSTLFWQG